MLLAMSGLRRCRWGIALALALFSAAASAEPAVTAAREYEIKAAFLFNLAGFITWPESNFNDDNDFHLCLLGTDPFGRVLDLLVAGQTVNDHPIILRRQQDISGSEHCEVLFISDSEQLRLPSIFEYLGTQAVLTVSDIPDFIVRGGMIKFFSQHNKVRLAIGLDNLRAASLKASSHLLRLSEIVSTP